MQYSNSYFTLIKSLSIKLSVSYIIFYAKTLVNNLIIKHFYINSQLGYPPNRRMILQITLLLGIYISTTFITFIELLLILELRNILLPVMDNFKLFNVLIVALHLIRLLMVK